MAGGINPGQSQGGAFRGMPSDMARKLIEALTAPVTQPADFAQSIMNGGGFDENGDPRPEASAGSFLAGLNAMGMGSPAASAAAAGEGMTANAGLRLFDGSRLGEVPNVPQFDLPRYTPPRGVPQRTLDITSDPGVRDQMLETISRGKKMGGAEWYNTDPLRERFNAELGDRGDQAYRKYMDLVAATSPQSKVPENVRNASYYYTRWMNGDDMPAIGDANPKPYGHKAQRLHQQNALAVAGDGWDPLKNPKPASFVENLAGNQQPATVDTHAFRLPAILGQDPRFLETSFGDVKGMPKQNIQAKVAAGEIPFDEALQRPAYWQGQPKANEYGAMEQYYQGLGRELGLTPAQTQASAWVGGGPVTGLSSASDKPFLGFLEDRIHKTATAYGQTPEEALSRFIRGQQALLSGDPSGMSSVAAALAQQPQQQPPQ